MTLCASTLLVRCYFYEVFRLTAPAPPGVLFADEPAVPDETTIGLLLIFERYAAPTGAPLVRELDVF